MKTPRTIFELDTPALLVDAQRLERNIERMQAVADAAGVKLRPHIKTHKCLAIAKRQLEVGAQGLTCAKLSEAEVMSEVCDDIFVAYPIVGEPKYERLERLCESTRVRVGVESVPGAKLLNEHLEKRGRTQPVMVKVDTGLRRTGVQFEELEELLQQLAGFSHLDVVGLFTHEGTAYGYGDREKIQVLLEDVAGTLSASQAIFEDVIGKKPELSPGCTLTAPLITKEHGFTEIRPGAYAFKDVYCTTCGIYEEDECALRVLVRVVSIKKNGRVVIDGGSKTFALDRHAEFAYGKVLEGPGMEWRRLTEEHGVLGAEKPDAFQVGQLLQVIPAHVCAVVNLHSHLVLHQDGRIIDRIPIDARGCVT